MMVIRRFTILAEVIVKKRYVVLLIVVVVLAVAAPFLNKKLDEFRVVLPELDRPPEIVKLDQNWTDAQRQQFHHTPQGTRLIPADWFKALEQPCFSPFGCGKFADPAYLSRFGFIPSHADALNPDGLPIGFAIDKDFVDPIDKSAAPVVGLTCAACHTGELHYGKYSVVVEGAPAMIEVAAFQKALGLALGFNTTFPFKYGRYGRFERNVLGPDATDEQKAELRRRLDAFVSAARHQAEVTQARKIYDNPAGFMRTDALTRIGNQVFAADTNIDDNYAVADSPVRFPQIWDASWFNWVQYNSSIADPLARNIGEALGVRAVAKLYGPDAGEFENSINMAGLRAVEDLARRSECVQGPRVAEMAVGVSSSGCEEGLGRRRAVQGALPEMSLAAAAGSRESAAGVDKDHRRDWWQSKNGNWYVQVTDVELEFIGTDPRQATDFMNRKASSGDLGKGVVSASEGLDLVTKGIADRFFRLQKISAEDQVGWAGGRDPADPRIRAELIYKARPLNGIWAVAPYLHNGSVPTLDALLSPDDSARPRTFWMGSKQFDPVNVGYSGVEIKGATLFDTTRPGNANTGHRFKDGPLGKGVIGRALTAEERAQIIEFLKSL